LPKSIPIRDLDRADIPYARAVLEGTGLFPPDMFKPMAEPYLTGQAPHHWLVAYEGEQFAGFVYAEPERMTDGTFNLLAMAVDPALQGRGIGTALVAALEARLRGLEARVDESFSSKRPAFRNMPAPEPSTRGNPFRKKREYEISMPKERTTSCSGSAYNK
jgi:GNAT superfamily N-acetyltransferase